LATSQLLDSRARPITVPRIVASTMPSAETYSVLGQPDQKGAGIGVRGRIGDQRLADARTRLRGREAKPVAMFWRRRLTVCCRRETDEAAISATNATCNADAAQPRSRHGAGRLGTPIAAISSPTLYAPIIPASARPSPGKID